MEPPQKTLIETPLGDDDVNAQVGKFVEEIREAIKRGDTPEFVRSDDFVTRIDRVTKDPSKIPSASGIDYKKNPVFLKVAEFFGVDEKEYPLAVNKVAAIIDWSAEVTDSNDISKMLTHIAETAKTLYSAGIHEKPYATLYRYIRLSEEKSKKQNELEQVQKQMESYKK